VYSNGTVQIQCDNADTRVGQSTVTNTPLFLGQTKGGKHSEPNPAAMQAMVGLASWKMHTQRASK